MRAPPLTTKISIAGIDLETLEREGNGEVGRSMGGEMVIGEWSWARCKKRGRGKRLGVT